MTGIDDIRTSHMVEGSTFAAYLDYDSSYLTAGADGKVNIYPALFDDESFSVLLESKITCLAVKNKLVVLSNEKHEVKSYILPDMKLNSILLRFTAAVNHLCINDNKDTVAAGASDFVIKTVSIDGNNQQTYSGHSAPILSVKFIGSQQLISSSCDGTVKVWDLKDQKCVKTLDLLPKSNSPPNCPGVLSVCETLKRIAIPSGKSVKIISSENWKEEFSLENEHKETVSNVCWSPTGKYLATASSKGEVFCWNVASRKCIKRYQQQESKGITSLEWQKPDEILFADEEGEFGVCEVPADERIKMKGDEFELDDDDDILATALGNDHDEETNDGEIFLSSAAKKSKKRPRPMDDDDDDYIAGGEDDGSDEPTSKKTRINNMDNFLDDQAEDDDDDEASISLNLIKEGFMEPIRKSVIDEDDDESVSNMPVQKVQSAKPIPPVVEVFMQPAFQPSSTPVHLQHRFMVWNAVGIIRCHRDDGVSSIDVEFHNANTSHPLHIANVLDHSMAALSSTAVVFACKKQDDMPSKLICMHFGSWDNNREWTISMNENENIMVIAANSSYVAIATSRGLLRILSVGGLQTQLLYLPGSVVSMAMHEREMIVIYHKSAGYKKCQCLGVTQYQYKKSNWKISSDDTLNLQTNVSVVWLGYSTEGTPSIVLSSGDVLLFHRTQQSWMVVGNTKEQVKNKSDNYWVIGIEEKQAQMRCIYCKGANFPALLPRPIPTFIGFEFPLCENATEKSKKEHELMKSTLLQSNMTYSRNSLRLPLEHNEDATERQQIQLLIQLFALACKADREFRAVEICKLMPSAESIELAIQYASKMRRMNIAKRLTELAQSRAAEEEQDKGESEIEDKGDQFDEFSDLSDGEPEVMQAKHSTPAIPKRPQLNGRRAIGAKPSTMEVSEDEHSEEEVNHSEEPSQSQQKSSQIESSAPKPRLSGNPFKVSQTNGSQQLKTSGAKGTDYFEKLETEKLSKTKQVKKNINDAVKRKRNKQNKITTFKSNNNKPEKKNRNESAKENIDFNVVGKEEQKPQRLTGFQLFLNKQKDTRSDDENSEEDFVPTVMRLWKELSGDEKKEWNTKAKGGQEVEKTKQINEIKNTKNNNNNNTTVEAVVDNVDRNKTETKTTMKTITTKNKLSSFAFQKS